MKDVIWTSSDSKIVSVDNDGKITAKQEGTVIIYVEYQGLKAEHTIEIVIPTEFSFAQAVMTVPFDKEVTIAFNATINGGLNNVILKADVKIS